MNSQPDTHTAPAVLDEQRYLTQTETTTLYGIRVANALSSAARNINHPIRRRKRGTHWEYNENDIVAWMDWQEEKEKASALRTKPSVAPCVLPPDNVLDVCRNECDIWYNMRLRNTCITTCISVNIIMAASAACVILLWLLLR